MERYFSELATAFVRGRLHNPQQASMTGLPRDCACIKSS